MNDSSAAHIDIVKTRRNAQGDEPTVLTDIYEDDVNIAIWRRDLDETLLQNVREFVNDKPGFQFSVVISNDTVRSDVLKKLGSEVYAPLADDIEQLVDMFCCLFELKQAGLRMTVLDKAMCPKFHVDRVPCRLITTYQGNATEWLPHSIVDRSKLGAGCNGLPDSESGIYRTQDDIQQLTCGDVGLLKGEQWFENEGGGLVHRSPAVDDEKRLVITLDFAG